MDERLRAFERAAEVDPNAQLQYYNERLRAGSMTRQQIEWLAILGDENAQKIHGTAASAVSKEFREQYLDQIREGLEVLLNNPEEGWDEEKSLSFYGCLAALKGHEKLADHIFQFASHTTCPECGESFRMCDHVQA